MTKAMRSRRHFPKRPPKRRCVRGHAIAQVGFYLNPARAPGTGRVYLVRRCKRCRTDDVIRCQRHGRSAAERHAWKRRHNAKRRAA